MPNSSLAALPQAVGDYIEAYNSFDIDRMLTQISPEIVFLNLAGGEVTNRTVGADRFADLARSAVAIFAERRQEVLSAIVDGNRVTLHIGYTARVAVDLPNGWKAGHRVEMSGVSLFRLGDGRIVELIDVT